MVDLLAVHWAASMVDSLVAWMAGLKAAPLAVMKVDNLVAVTADY